MSCHKLPGLEMPEEEIIFRIIKRTASVKRYLHKTLLNTEYKAIMFTCFSISCR